MELCWNLYEIAGRNSNLLVEEQKVLQIGNKEDDLYCCIYALKGTQ